MEKKDNIDIEKIKQEQVKKIKQAIETIINKNEGTKEKNGWSVLFYSGIWISSISLLNSSNSFSILFFIVIL